MDGTGLLLVWSVNLIVGLGLILLGVAMARRPDRVWVGVRVPRDAPQIARIRRGNRRTAPWLLLLGAVDVLSGLIAFLAGLSPLVLAFTGLAILLLAIVVVALAAFL